MAADSIGTGTYLEGGPRLGHRFLDEVVRDLARRVLVEHRVH